MLAPLTGEVMLKVGGGVFGVVVWVGVVVGLELDAHPPVINNPMVNNPVATVKMSLCFAKVFSIFAPLNTKSQRLEGFEPNQGAK